MSEIGMAMALYGICAAVLGLVGGSMTDSASWRSRRDGARLIFLCPIWPVVLVVSLTRGLYRLWQIAAWNQRG